jgi:hypothetical protein
VVPTNLSLHTVLSGCIRKSLDISLSLAASFYLGLLLGGSFIASTACQQAIDNTTIPQFNRELYLLEIINIFLLIDQPILYFTTGASWSFVLLFFYYFLVLCVTNEVHSRLKKEVTTPTDGIRRGQPQEQWSTQ